MNNKIVWLLLLVATALALAVAGQAHAGSTVPGRTGPVLLGAAFQSGQVQSNPTYTRQLLSHNYSVLTPEWEQYMDQVETSPGVFNFTGPDTALQFAQNND